MAITASGGWLSWKTCWKVRKLTWRESLMRTKKENEIFVKASKTRSAVVNEQHLFCVNMATIIIIIATIIYCTSFTSSSWANRLYTTVYAMVGDSGPVLNVTLPISRARVSVFRLLMWISTQLCNFFANSLHPPYSDSAHYRLPNRFIDAMNSRPSIK